MKMRLMICFVVLASVSGFSQSYKKVKIGLEIHLPKGSALPILNVEPSYRINDKFLFGYRFETGGISEDLITKSNGLHSQYYFINSKSIRVFAGIGIGFFSIKQQSSSSAAESGYTLEKDKLGFFPRLGFDLGHFTLTVDYNWMTQYKATSTNILNGNTDVSYVNGNYFGIKAGFSIGGGKKKKH